VRTCRDQWDWHANAPSCAKYIIEWNITAHPNDPCKMCPSTCYRDVCDENGENCYEESYDCEVPCGTTYTADPECVPFEYDCRAGYAVGFNDYTYMPFPNGYDKYPYLEQKVGSSENMNYSLKDGWPDWVLGGSNGTPDGTVTPDGPGTVPGILEPDDEDPVIIDEDYDFGELFYAGGVCLESPETCFFKASLKVNIKKKNGLTWEAPEEELDDVFWQIEMPEFNNSPEGTYSWYDSGDQINVIISSKAPYMFIGVHFDGDDLDTLEAEGYEVDRNAVFKVENGEEGVVFNKIFYHEDYSGVGRYW
jgi:hypothetical protein